MIDVLQNIGLALLIILLLPPLMALVVSFGFAMALSVNWFFETTRVGRVFEAYGAWWGRVLFDHVPALWKKWGYRLQKGAQGD